MVSNEDSMIASSLSDIVMSSSTGNKNESSGKTNQASQHLGKQRQYWRDIILGVNDGLVSTFLLVAGVVGGGLATKDILLTAISGSLAGAVSMFAGEFVATRAQESVMSGELQLESEHIKNHHSEEIEELHGLLTLIGIPEEDSPDTESAPSTLRAKLISHYSADHESLFKIMKALEFGVIDEERRSPVVAALASFFCFIAGSMSSTIPFIFVKTPTAGLYASIIATFICLFAVGLIKTYATREHWIKSCFDNLFIPVLGGAIAFGIGKAFEKGLA